jgi:hypothetical protein
MRFKNLDRYKTGSTGLVMHLEIPPPKTPRGRVYRYSPNETAYPRHFVLGEFDQSFTITEAARGRMRITPRSKQTVCPYSGVVAKEAAFTHPDDIQAAIQIVGHEAEQDVRGELERMFARAGLSSNGAIRIKASTPPSSSPRPQFSRPDLLREVVCDQCGRDYGVYAIGLFCPDCGAPNLRLHFAREGELVRTQVELAEAQPPESQELAYRLLGNAHEDVLTAFEATLKTLYLYGMSQRAPDAAAVRPIGNDFQNLEKARRRFAELTADPCDCLDAEERATLDLNIQKRHIIGHNLSVMDGRFAQHSQDARLGETVRLVGVDICAFVALCQRVIDRLDDWLGNSRVPPPDLPSVTAVE